MIFYMKLAIVIIILESSAAVRKTKHKPPRYRLVPLSFVRNKDGTWGLLLSNAKMLRNVIRDEEKLLRAADSDSSISDKINSDESSEMDVFQDYDEFTDLTRIEESRKAGVDKDKTPPKKRDAMVVPVLAKLVPVVRKFGKSGGKKRVGGYSPKSIEDKSSSEDSSTQEGAVHIPKRFEIVENAKVAKKKKYILYDASNESDEDDEPVTEPPVKKKHKPKYPDRLKKKLPAHVKKFDEVDPLKTGKKEVYLQGGGRIMATGPQSDSDSTENQLEEDDDFRRKLQDFRKRYNRLPYFLPKRYIWQEEDFHSLGYYWFHGPQGKYPGVYKVGY